VPRDKLAFFAMISNQKHIYEINLGDPLFFLKKHLQERVKALDS
jgi:hypothetical protein